MRRAGLAVMMAAMLPGMAAAEDAWIRVEAKRGPAAAAAIAEWRDKYPDVQTFDLPNGMTGIALGPQEAAAAAARMAQLKASGAIPGDSYLTAPGGIAPLAGALAAATAGQAVAAAGPVAPTEAAPAAAAPSAPVDTAGTHIQLQATPGRISANEALERWRRSFPEAGLFRLPNGVFAVALAPDTPERTAERLAALKRDRRIPSDAYLSTTAELGTVLEPTGAVPAAEATAAGAPTPAPPSATGTAATTPDLPAAGTAVDPAQPGAGAPPGASTAGLDAPVPAEPAPVAPAVMPPLDEVQRALHWAGFYDGPIDGKSGPGTRAAIEAETAATSPGSQPAEAMVALIARRDAWRGEIGLARLDDPATGLGLMAPTGRLAFDRVERGLSIYGPKDGSGAALILTRQPGGQQEMLDFAGLVTALGWVPQPARDVGRGRVSLDGADAEHAGHAEARVVDGQVEGWVLIWPAADADNARRLAAEMTGTVSWTPPAEATATAGEPVAGTASQDAGGPDAGPTD